MSTLKAAINHPWTAIRRLKVNLTRPFIDPPEDRVNIIEEDWDNLIILDACRFDTFEKFNTIDGDLKRIHSNVSHTAEFVEKNVRQQYLDVVYVTASPQLAGVEDHFHHVEHLWQDSWNEDLRTVTPEIVTERAIDVAQSYPDKRIIVHYMQPHYPFIGEKAECIGEHATFTGSNVEERDHPSVWDLLVSRQIDAKTVKTAYEENLQVALPHVNNLVNALEGKTVISSDHGNLFRKKTGTLPIRIEGHPENYPDPDLISVPWLECPYDSRKNVTTTEPDQTAEDPDEKAVQDRLEDLGYLS